METTEKLASQLSKQLIEKQMSLLNLRQSMFEELH